VAAGREGGGPCPSAGCRRRAGWHAGRPPRAPCCMQVASAALGRASPQGRRADRRRGQAAGQRGSRAAVQSQPARGAHVRPAARHAGVRVHARDEGGGQQGRQVGLQALRGRAQQLPQQQACSQPGVGVACVAEARRSHGRRQRHAAAGGALWRDLRCRLIWQAGLLLLLLPSRGWGRRRPAAPQPFSCSPRRVPTGVVPGAPLQRIRDQLLQALVARVLADLQRQARGGGSGRASRRPSLPQHALAKGRKSEQSPRAPRQWHAQGAACARGGRPPAPRPARTPCAPPAPVRPSPPRPAP
jgi:hypothetical protein